MADPLPTPVATPQSSRRLLAISGSLRRRSLNSALLRAAAERTPDGVELLVEEGVGTLPLFDADLERATDGGPETVRALRRRVAAADGLLLATPEYNGSIPGPLKNAIDWLSREDPRLGRVLADRPVAILGASSGLGGTQNAQRDLREVLRSCRAQVLPNPTFLARRARELFDDEGRLTDGPTIERLAALLAAFERWIGLVAQAHDVHA